MKRFLIYFLFPIFTYAVDWNQVTNEVFQETEKYHLLSVSKGASNHNYSFSLDGKHYFMRVAPKKVYSLYSDIEVEYKVLESLSELNVSPRPIYFNEHKKILVTEFIENEEEGVNLLDSETRKEVIKLLRQIEGAQIDIAREFQPYEEVVKLTDMLHDLHDPLANYFQAELLPVLKRIEQALSKKQTKSLCHLDLHHFNILKSPTRLWIIDWEFATLGDPFLTLGSMASIERWNDEQMASLLNDYKPNYSERDFHRLFLYRIVADIFWVAWNHLQRSFSPLDRPYELWEKLFLEAALERINSPKFDDALKNV